MHHARTTPSHALLCCRRPASEEHILALETGTIRLAFKSNNSHPKLDLRSRTTTPSDRTGNLNSYCQGKPRSSAELLIKTSQSAQFPINFGFSVKVMMERQHGGGRLSLGTAETLISFTSSFRSQPSRLPAAISVRIKFPSDATLPAKSADRHSGGVAVANHRDSRILMRTEDPLHV